MESAVKAAAKSYAASEKVPYEQLNAYGIHSRLKKVAGVDTLLETVEKEEAKGIKSSPASKKEAKLTKVFETTYKKAFKSMKGGDEATSPLATLNKIQEKQRFGLRVSDSVRALTDKLENPNYKLTPEEQQSYARILQEATQLGYITPGEASAAAYSPSGSVGGFRRRSQTAKFNRCVKKVRKTVKARKGSTKESAAIGICVKSVLHTRGRTIKRYSKKRLVTQKRK